MMSDDEEFDGNFQSKPTSSRTVTLYTAEQLSSACSEGYAAGYKKATEDCQTVTQTEFDRWLDDPDADYPSFDNIDAGIQMLRNTGGVK